MKNKSLLLAALIIVGLVCLTWGFLSGGSEQTPSDTTTSPKKVSRYKPRLAIDTSGFVLGNQLAKPWRDPTSLQEIRDSFTDLGKKQIERVNRSLTGQVTPMQRVEAYMYLATWYMFDGLAKEAYAELEKMRDLLKTNPQLEERYLYTVIFFQGVAGIRRGENENCLDCRGEGACIFPIRSTAVHAKQDGSRLAVKHFTEYLSEFPDDLGVRWLLNLAYMTLGEYPAKVPAQYLLHFDKFGNEADIGKFQDISHLLGLNRMNEAGGAIMDDFDNDGLLDIVVTSADPTQAMAFFRNKGDGTFEDRTSWAGLSEQFGGLNCVQTDYNNDGYLDIFIPRGAWLKKDQTQDKSMRPSLLRNNKDGTFTDVTRQAGLMDPLNSVCGAWADYDNDGYLDLFICNESGLNRLYHNRGDGTFEEVAAKAGVTGKNLHCKGAAWIDFDNNGLPDLFISYMDSTPQFFRNNGNGTFTDVSSEVGITGPKTGFSCWAFDFDNDGYLDIFTTCYERTLEDVVAGIIGSKPVTPGMGVTRLYRNIQGQRFEDISQEVGVDNIYSTMGSNFGDFDNDGFLDIYLSTGEPYYSSLIPNRMFKNMGGKRFADITTTSGTGHLQKGHGVACGDWNRDGAVDLFLELGGAVPGDRYHNVMFQNPGQGNHWICVKLVGVKTNRPAIGARIKVITAGDSPQTIHRHVSSGSSFGGNPLQQHIGLGKATKVATLEINWPTSGTTQTFHDVPVNQAIEITEFAQQFRPLNWKPIPVPKN